MARRETDPIGNYNFLVEIDDLLTASFSEVSGLKSETEVIEYREGGEVTTAPRKLPGLHKVGNITLKRGVTGAKELWDWRNEVVSGQFQRRTVVIQLLDEQRQTVCRWVLRDAWPVKFEGPSLKATGNEIAIEVLELACERIEIRD